MHPRKSTASGKVEDCRHQGVNRKRHCHAYSNTAMVTELEESDRFADVEEDEDELEKNKLVAEDC